MAKKPVMRVALDLETTGLHPEQDAILEIAAVKFQDSAVIDTFETFVTPGRAVPYRVQRLTGIKPEQLVGAPVFSAIAGKLEAFLGDLPIVGHSIPFDVSFLRPRGIARTNPLIDTFELATVLLPSLASYNLGQVAQALGVTVPQDRHRAMVDTVLAMEVFLALHQRLSSVDLALLNDLAHLAAPRSWSLLQFFRQELRERRESDGLHGALARGSLGDSFAAQLGMDPRVFSLAIARQPAIEQAPPASEIEPPAAVGLDTLAQVQTIVEANPAEPIAPGHGYSAAHSAVRQALEQHNSLLMDLAVGGYDYTPALLPALEWLIAAQSAAEAQPRRLVIACASLQGTRRLIETTLPRLQQSLKSQLPVAYLAERNGYLCTHRWFGAALRRNSGELTAEEARGLAKLALWAHQTTSGERGEITLLQQEQAAWERVSSGVEHFPSPDAPVGNHQDCTYRRKGYCFVSLAEERVKAARIVVTTHAGLFDDLLYEHSLLANIQARLLLDADLLEEENARWSCSELDQARLLSILNMIGTELPDGHYQGLLALLVPTLRENGPGGLAKTATIAKSELDARLLSWFQALRQASTAIEQLFACFHLLLEDFVQQGSGNKGRSDAAGRAYNGRNSERTDQPLRLTSQTRQLGAWTETEQAWQQAAQRLQAVIDVACEAEKMILAAHRQRSSAHRPDMGSGDDRSVVAELMAAAYRLSQQKDLLQRTLSLGDSETAYWLRMPPTPSFTQQRGPDSAISTQAVAQTPIVYAQLAQTATFLKRVLLKDDATSIFVGTALAVDNSFAFMRNRFGLDSESCSALSVVSEHHEQTLLYIPNDVPEPNAPQYQRHVDDALVQLASALNGQVVALFTSHAALRSSCATIKPLLETRGILALGQGVDGSPRQLWQVFQSQERVVLLGTGSFWDSMEEIQRLPTCLVIARVPMPVLNDPPIAARAEHYSDQLHQLTVPMAALRMRRTLNRLAWSDQKRNVVVLFDRRVISKEYGSMILHSLPRCSQRQAAASHMTETVLDWLTGTGAWEENSV
jgi:ATP-dependent DNA helicase DinG